MAQAGYDFRQVGHWPALPIPANLLGYVSLSRSQLGPELREGL